MWAINHATNRATNRANKWATTVRRQRGAMAVEFALTVGVFFVVVFMVVELARALYLWNTLQEVTRRAAYEAAVTDFRNDEAMNAVRWRAVLRNNAGVLPLGAPVTDADVHIDYLALPRSASGAMTPTLIATTDLPQCPARARLNCIADPNGASCIRLVRVRICKADANGCTPLTYQSMVPLVPVTAKLPRWIVWVIFLIRICRQARRQARRQALHGHIALPGV